MAAENPFPGMNPFLERRWGDVHSSLVTYARDLLQEKLPDSLRARMQERVFIEQTPRRPAPGFYPDVHVFEQPQQARSSSSAVAVATLAEPTLIHMPADEITESFIEIVDADSGGRVITVIEFLSRSNKQRGPGRRLYLKKQRECRRGRVNLVEIDLLRGERPTTLCSRFTTGDLAMYHASVFRASRPDRLEYYEMPLRQRLPMIRIPLRRKDADVGLDIQELVDLAYRRGRYDDIDYAQPLDPPLPAEDARWVEGLLKEKTGRR